ncbi:hypothetical protein [Methylobacterium nonmethylotrophicum]|nr:hypothetical protein [Methylobacterium nonmethylotrophicum]
MMRMRAGFVVLITALMAPFSLSAQPALDRTPVSEVYTGPKRLPDFSGSDREYRSYRSRIVEGIKAGPNFAGQYSLIVFGCGTGCRLVMLADVKTGQQYKFPLGGEDDMYLDLKFNISSRTVFAQWENRERCMRELLTWTGSSFARTGAKDIGASEKCSL